MCIRDRALGAEHVAEGGVTGVAGAAQHGIQPADLSGEKDAVAVIREKGILQLVEGFKIKGVAHTEMCIRDRYSGSCAAKASISCLSAARAAEVALSCTTACSTSNFVVSDFGMTPMYLQASV